MIPLMLGHAGGRSVTFSPPEDSDESTRFYTLAMQRLRRQDDSHKEAVKRAEGCIKAHYYPLAILLPTLTPEQLDNAQ